MEMLPARRPVEPKVIDPVLRKEDRHEKAREDDKSAGPTQQTQLLGNRKTAPKVDPKRSGCEHHRAASQREERGLRPRCGGDGDEDEQEDPLGIPRAPQDRPPVEGDETERHQIESCLDGERQWIPVCVRRVTGVASDGGEQSQRTIKEHGDSE